MQITPAPFNIMAATLTVAFRGTASRAPAQICREVDPMVGPLLKELAIQKECRIEEGHLMADHIHMLISIPPKYSVAQIVGFIKGKNAISIARNYMGRKKNFTGQKFWARGYHVSTVGRDEEVIRSHIPPAKPPALLEVFDLLTHSVGFSEFSQSLQRYTHPKRKTASETFRAKCIACCYCNR